MIEVQNEVDLIIEVKQKEGEIDIETLKLVREALKKILKKWRDVILELINRHSACSKPDTKKKDDKPDTKKKDDKPDTKKKDDKPDTKKKDDKPDTKKKDNKPDNKKKDNKPDTSKNNIENMASNRIKYEIQDIAKYRKVLIEMIDERIHTLDLTNMWLAESIDDTDIRENMSKFRRLCNANRIVMSYNMTLISEIYAVNLALECLRHGVGNGIWPKDVSYNLITCIGDIGVEEY